MASSSLFLSLCNGGGREGAVGQGRVFGRNSLEFFGAASEQRQKEEARQLLLPGKKTKAKIIKGRKILRRPMLSLIAVRRIKHLRAKHFAPDIESNALPLCARTISLIPHTKLLQFPLPLREIGGCLDFFPRVCHITRCLPSLSSYLPDFVMTISVPKPLNFCQSSLDSSETLGSSLTEFSSLLESAAAESPSLGEPSGGGGGSPGILNVEETDAKKCKT